MIKSIFQFSFYFSFWGAFVGFYFVGMGARTGDTDLLFFGLPYALLGSVLSIVSYKILKNV